MHSPRPPTPAFGAGLIYCWSEASREGKKQVLEGMMITGVECLFEAGGCVRTTFQEFSLMCPSAEQAGIIITPSGQVII